jgi:hypothetical protein
MRKVASMLGILVSLCAGFYAGICVLSPSALADPSGCGGVSGGIERGAADGNAVAGPVGAIFGGVIGGVVGAFCIEPEPKNEGRSANIEPEPMYEGRSANRSNFPHKIDGQAGKEYHENAHP